MNEEQLAFWNGVAGKRWTDQQTVLDRAIQAFGRAALDAAAAQSGERALDVGCGCGDTALELAQRVGPSGSVLGIDLSAAMLERARERATARTNVEFRQGDATSIALPAEFDLLFSRFGVMFFDDPVASFSNLRKALRGGGRLSFVAWRAYEENPSVCVPVETVLALVPEMPVPFKNMDVPGPYAFADRDKVARILSGAGFSAIAIERFDGDVALGADLDEAVAFAINAGPVSRIFGEATPDVQAKAREALHRVLAPYGTERGFAMPGSTWIVTARA